MGFRRERARFLAVALLMGACGPSKPETADHRYAEQVAPASPDELQALIERVRGDLYPELSGVPIEVIELKSELDMFNSNLDLNTVSWPPLKRHYEMKSNFSKLFHSGLNGRAFACIVAHELKHMLDYTKKNTDDLVGFGLWYATADTHDYEHATDEHALELGCATGLTDYRLWLYQHLAPDVVAQKQYTYYTPEEIAAYLATHPE